MRNKFKEGRDEAREWSRRPNAVAKERWRGAGRDEEESGAVVALLRR